MADGPSPAGGTGGATRPPAQPNPGLSLRVALAALLIAVVLAGIAAAIPHTDWTRGPAHRQGTAVGIGLEAVLAGLLFAAERHRRRWPVVGQPATGLRAMLRAVLIAGLAAIPALILINLAGQFKPRPQRLRPPVPTSRVRRIKPAKLGNGPHIDLALVLYVVIAVVLLAAIVACLIYLARRVSRGPDLEDLGDLGEEETEEQLREAVRSGQAALHEIDDARLAIIACYVAMEQSLAKAGAARGAAETPDELLDRAAAGGLVAGGEAARLTALFYEARYSTHPLPVERRDEARHALEVLAAGLSRTAERADQAAAGEAR